MGKDPAQILNIEDQIKGEGANAYSNISIEKGVNSNNNSVNGGGGGQAKWLQLIT